MTRYIYLPASMSNYMYIKYDYLNKNCVVAKTIYKNTK